MRGSPQPRALGENEFAFFATNFKSEFDGEKKNKRRFRGFHRSEI